MIAFTSSSVCCSSRASGRTPNRRTIAFESRFSATVNGALTARNTARGRARFRSRLLGARDRQHLRYLLPDRDVDRGHQEERDHDRDRDRDAVGQAAEDGLQQVGHGRLAQEADRDRRHRDPHLAGGEVLVQAAELVQRLGRSAGAFVGQLLEPRPPRSNQRELGRDEQPVEQPRGAAARLEVGPSSPLCCPRGGRLMQPGTRRMVVVAHPADARKSIRGARGGRRARGAWRIGSPSRRRNAGDLPGLVPAAHRLTCAAARAAGCRH